MPEPIKGEQKHQEILMYETSIFSCKILFSLPDNFEDPDWFYCYEDH